MKPKVEAAPSDEPQTRKPEPRTGRVADRQRCRSAMLGLEKVNRGRIMLATRADRLVNYAACRAWGCTHEAAQHHIRSLRRADFDWYRNHPILTAMGILPRI